uniref:Polyketide synthase n=1 Tax=Peronospora matthiolae TaxID=2874970 RepID=A0AAV1THY8_9STRA
MNCWTREADDGSAVEVIKHTSAWVKVSENKLACCCSEPVMVKKAGLSTLAKIVAIMCSRNSVPMSFFAERRTVVSRGQQRDESFWE